MIDRLFTKTITVQSETQEFGGASTFSDIGSNRGYIRILGSGERVSADKPELFSTHRAVMEVGTVPSYGQYLLCDGVRYRVKLPDPHTLSGGDFQTVDCELVQ